MHIYTYVYLYLFEKKNHCLFGEEHFRSSSVSFYDVAANYSLNRSGANRKISAVA